MGPRLQSLGRIDILPRGKTARIPAETLLTSRLEQALAMGIADNRVNRKGRHYHARQR